MVLVEAKDDSPDRNDAADTNEQSKPIDSGNPHYDVSVLRAFDIGTIRAGPFYTLNVAFTPR